MSAELKGIFHYCSSGTCIFHPLSARKTVKMCYLWWCCFVLSFLAKAGNINGGRSVDTPTPAALLILLHSPLCASNAAQQPGGRQVLSSASGELDRGSNGKPTARILAARAASVMEGAQQHPELGSGQFCLEQVQPRGIQSRWTAAGGHVCGCNTLLSLVKL